MGHSLLNPNKVAVIFLYSRNTFRVLHCLLCLLTLTSDFPKQWFPKLYYSAKRKKAKKPNNKPLFPNYL